VDNRERYEVAYREAVRALDYQRSAIDALRTRVGYLVSAAAIATSFLGGLALEDGASVGGWVAIGLFVAFGAEDSVAPCRRMREEMAKRPQPILLPNPMRPFPGDPAPQSQPK
jgi:hypothetical protein